MSAPAVNSKNALLFVLITVMINSIGFGIMIPVLPDLIKELTGLENHQAVKHSGLLTLVFAVFQFICMPIVGGLSDRFGRRPIMYVADVSPPEKRAQNFGLIGASFGVGFLLGPVIGGILGEYGTRVPFYAAGIISLINVIYGFIFLPETGIFGLFADTANRATRQMQAFPDNLMGILQYMTGAPGIPYIPGSPFLLAGALSFIALVTFILVTNKADRDARYEPNNVPSPDPDGLEKPASFENP